MSIPECEAGEAKRVGWAAPLWVGLVVLAYGALKLHGLGHGVGDENAYFYLATRMAQGASPYVDFFHAHPPLHLLPLAVVYAIGDGFSLLPARLLAAGATAISGLLLFLLLRREDALAAAFACTLYLLSYDVLRLSTHFTGSNLAAMWVAAGLERMVRGRDAQAAIAFSLGGFTLLNAAPAAVGATLALMAVDLRRGLRLALLGVVSFAVLNACALAWFGSVFIEQVYLFHLGKSGQSGELATVVGAMLFMNPWLLGGAAMGVMAAFLGDGGSGSQPNEPSLRQLMEARPGLAYAVAGALGSLVFLALSPRVFVYYFHVFLVCAAPLAGFGLASLCRALAGFNGTEKARNAGAAGVLSLVLVGVHWPIVRAWTADGEARRHPWRPTGITVVDAATRPFFLDGEEVDGRRRLAWSHYLWHEADRFESAPRLAAALARACPPDASLFGASTAAPLVALLADRRLTLDEADTNWTRVAAEGEQGAAFLRRIETQPPCAALKRGRHGVFGLPVFAAWLAEHYDLVLREEEGNGDRVFELFVRRDAFR